MLSIRTKAQRGYRYYESFSIGLNVGTSSFYGDLTDKKNRIISNTPFHRYFYEDRELMYGFWVQKRLSSNFNTRGQFLFGKVTSTSESQLAYFKADYFEYTLNGTINLSNYIWGQDDFRKFNWYGVLGIGFANWNVTKFDLNTDKAIGSNGYWKKGKPGYKLTTTETVMPIGLGFEWQWGDHWNFNFETTIRPINTDKFDATLSKDKWWEGTGYTMIGLSYEFDMDRLRVGRSNPKFNNRSKEPSLRKYQKQKQVVMNTKQYRKAVKKRYKHKYAMRKPWWQRIFSKKRVNYAK